MTRFIKDFNTKGMITPRIRKGVLTTDPRHMQKEIAAEIRLISTRYPQMPILQIQEILKDRFKKVVDADEIVKVINSTKLSKKSS